MILSFFVYGDLFRPEGIPGGGVFCCNVRRGAAFGQYQVAVRLILVQLDHHGGEVLPEVKAVLGIRAQRQRGVGTCLLYTSDAADE